MTAGDVDISRVVLVRQAKVSVGLDALHALSGYEVYDTAYGIRAVDCGSAVSEHLDTLQHGWRQDAGIRGRLQDTAADHIVPIEQYEGSVATRGANVVDVGTDDG